MARVKRAVASKKHRKRAVQLAARRHETNQKPRKKK